MSEVTTTQQPADLISFSRSYLRNSKKSAEYKAACQVAFSHLEEFSELEELTFYTDSMYEFIFEDFVYFLQTKGLMLSTINNILSKIKYILRKAAKRGFPVNWDFEDFNVDDEEADTTYLSRSEIKKIYDLEALTPKQAIIRDYFIIACLTGLRYSDLIRLTKEHIHGRVIKIRMKKTKILTEIPLHKTVKDIFRSYHNQLPPAPSSQYFNRAIKTIVKKAGITDLIPYDRQVGLHRQTFLRPKYDQISSHTGRRSMATNMFLAGFKTPSIMLITGHTSESSFLRYIRISRNKNALTLSNNDHFKSII